MIRNETEEIIGKLLAKNIDTKTIPTEEIYGNKEGKTVEEFLIKNIEHTETVGEIINIIDRTRKIDNENVERVEEIGTENIVGLANIENCTITKEIS